MYPLARKDNRAIEVLRDETLVYDPKTHQAHCLNPIAAMIWQSCDGETSVTEIVRRLSSHYEASIDERVVLHALEQLKAAHLVEPRSCPKPGPSARRLSRRKVSAGAAMLWPLVSSLTIPAARAQRSFRRPPRPPRPRPFF